MAVPRCQGTPREWRPAKTLRPYPDPSAPRECTKRQTPHKLAPGQAAKGVLPGTSEAPLAIRAVPGLPLRVMPSSPGWRGLGRMAFVVLITWSAAVLAGLYMLAVWLIENDVTS